MLAALAPFGLLGEIPIAVVLVAVGVALIVHGGYEEFVKPRFRVGQRLNDWLQRRGWDVRIEPRPEFNFLLHLTAPGSGKQIVVTRDKHTRGDVLAFTAKVGLDPRWLGPLDVMSQKQRQLLIQEITILLATKNIGFDLANPLDRKEPIRWPPDVKVQTALAQDHTLSQHSVDLAAKSIEQSMIAVRALIRKAILDVNDEPDEGPTLTPSPESTPDTEPPEPH